MSLPDPTPAARLARGQHLWLVLAVVLCRVLVLRTVPIYDDAFITYRYARNLAEGAGLVFNPGAAWEPVLGTTTPLYALILAGLARVGADVIAASLTLNIALDAVTALLLPRFFGFARAASVFALLAFAAFPPLVRITVGGMESPLFALCGVGATLALAARRPGLSGVLAATACLVRPEGVLLCAVLGVAVLRAKVPVSVRDVVRFGVPIVVIGIVAVAVLTAVYGSPIPQSVLAKSTMRQGDPLHESVVRWKNILSQAFLPHVVLLPVLPFVAWGAWVALRRGGALRWFSMWALAITVSYLIARPHTWGWYYCVPLVAWSMWLGLGAGRAMRWIALRVGVGVREAAGRHGAQALAIGAVAAAAVAGWRRPATVDERVYAPLLEWARATSRREPGARVLASDIGAIGWGWEGTVLDSEGLVWPGALVLGQPVEIIAAEAPEYVLLVAERPRLRQFRSRPEVFGLYEPVARFSVRGEGKLDPTPEEVLIDWSQDYIAYRRK